MDTKRVALMNINNNIYSMPEKQAMNIIKAIQNEIEKKKIRAYMIIALEKDGIIEMRNETYASLKALMKRIKELKLLGFKVYSVGENANEK